MKTRKFAWKALVILLIVAGLSLYFSGTVRSVLTPKVQMFTPNIGRLKEKLTVPCKLSYLDPQEFRYELKGKVMVRQVFVRPGDRVEKGDTLFALEFLGEEGMERQLMDAYSEALLAGLDFKRNNASLKLSVKEQSYVAAYRALKAATVNEGAARQRAQGLLPPDIALPQSGYPLDADGEVTAAIDLWRTEDKKKTEAESAFAEVSGLRMRDSVQNYIMQQQVIEDRLSGAQYSLHAFYTSQSAMREIKAPHGGYIASVAVKAWDEYDGNSSLCTLTSESGEALLEADISGVKKSVPVGAGAIVECDFGSFSSQVKFTGFNSKGAKCAYIALPDDMLEMISLPVIHQAKMEVHLELETADSYTLVPVSAIRGSGGENFVYIVEESKSALGGAQMKVKKFTVNVVDDADGMAAIQEDLSSVRLAHMEDREISDGSTVMRYLK